jgi:hypothetical protein
LPLSPASGFPAPSRDFVVIPQHMLRTGWMLL